MAPYYFKYIKQGAIKRGGKSSQHPVKIQISYTSKTYQNIAALHRLGV
jgi:hypothetical protein